MYKSIPRYTEIYKLTVKSLEYSLACSIVIDFSRNSLNDG